MNNEGKKKKGRVRVIIAFFLLMSMVLGVWTFYVVKSLRPSGSIYVFDGWTYGREDQKKASAALAEAGLDRRALDRLAPVKMEVPSGSQMTIHYEESEPFVAVRLQECFGLQETPKVAGGKVPIVMRLLSPAQRPVQITKDLAGFWKGAYALVRKDLRGRYPKHYWPEDPSTAVATRRVRPK